VRKAPPAARIAPENPNRAPDFALWQWLGAVLRPNLPVSIRHQFAPGPQPGTCVFGQVGQCCFDNGLTERHQMDTGNNPPFPARNRHFI
jgi:hypothetical protein